MRTPQKTTISQKISSRGVEPPKYSKDRNYDFWSDTQVGILELLLKSGKTAESIARKVRRLGQPKKVQITKIKI
jgi:NCAIR mutase (PurE)-related protein